MNRVKKAAELINKQNDITTLLDVGCRDCILKQYLSANIKYTGLDLFQNNKNTVAIVGDINSTHIPETSYDCVVALDILEHTDDPYLIFNKLARITKKYLVINLPNGYDLKSRKKFILGHLGDKYSFKTENRLDRHRWIMGYDEIVRFYVYKSKEFNSELEIINIQYGQYKPSFTSIIGLLLRILPNALSAESVLGFFKKE